MYTKNSLWWALFWVWGSSTWFHWIQLVLTRPLDLTDPFRIGQNFCSSVGPAIFIKVSPLFDFIFSYTHTTHWNSSVDKVAVILRAFLKHLIQENHLTVLYSIVANLCPSWFQARDAYFCHIFFCPSQIAKSQPDCRNVSDKRGTGC